MKYSVVIFPSVKVQEVANSYRKRYDPTYASIPPFIRLKEAFDLEEAILPHLVDKLQTVADSTEAFDIHFHRASTFHPTTNTIFLAFQNKESVEKLHQKIGEAIDSKEETFAYVPHLTIGRDLTNDECKDIFGQLSMTKFDLTSEVDRFHLIYQLEGGIWSVYQTFLLKK